MLSNGHTNLLLHLIALQKLNGTSKGTACIPELHTEVEKVFTIHTKQTLWSWGQDDHIELDLELHIHNFCSEVTCMLIAQCVSGLQMHSPFQRRL